MRVFARRSKKYQGGLAALLLALIVGNVVVIRHRMQEATPTQPWLRGSSISVTKPPTLGPAAQVVSGVPTQGPFTLEVVTRPPIPMTPPAGIAAQLGASDLVQAMGDGIGVWIKVVGGIGMQTISVPAGSGQTTFPIGGGRLVITNTAPPPPPPPTPTLLERIAHLITPQGPRPSTSGGFSGTIQWYGPGGVTPLPNGERPYEAMWDTTATWGKSTAAQFVLVPRHLDQQFAVTAQALTGQGTPLGGPVTLLCQPVNADTFFVFLPSGYSPQTAQFALTVARNGVQAAAAHWRLSSLPRPLPGVPGTASVCTQQQAGPLTVEAAAAESPDLGGQPPWWDSHLDRQAGYWTLSPPQNVDDHQWTGVPTIRCVLRAQGARAGEDWVVNVTDAVPEWRPAPLPQMARVSPAPGGPPVRALFGVAPPYPGRPAPKWSQCDLVCGAAYPGQQRRLRVEAEAVRYAYQWETLAFKNASLQRDPASGHWEVCWQKAQTLTTPSGISVVVLNRRPGDTPRATPGPVWNMQTAAELWLAWRVPPGAATPGTAGASVQEFPPGVPPPLSTISPPFSERSPTWNDVWLPGTPPPVAVPDSRGRVHAPPLSTTPLAALSHGGYQVVHLWVDDPRVLASPALGLPGGTPPPPLPARLATLPVVVGKRGIVERHPIHLIVPIQAHFPTGWNPDDADGRSHVFY